MSFIYNICVPNTSRDFFDYYSDTLEPCIGARVWVPFRNQTRLGVVVSKYAVESLPAKIKTISAVIDDKPLLSAVMLTLCQWVSQYYQSALSEVIPLALPKKYRDGEAYELPVCDYYALTMDAELAHALLPARGHRQHALVDYIANHLSPSLAKKTILQAGFNRAQLDALLAIGILAKSEQRDKPQGQITLERDGC